MPSWKVGDIAVMVGMGPAYPRRRRIVEVMGDGYYAVHHPDDPSVYLSNVHESNLITPTIKEERMPETINILETALEQEAKLFLKLINELEGDDLYGFIRRVTEIKISGVGSTPVDEVVHVAQNITNIETALENFYRI